MRMIRSVEDSSGPPDRKLLYYSHAHEKEVGKWKRAYSISIFSMAANEASRNLYPAVLFEFVRIRAHARTHT